MVRVAVEAKFPGLAASAWQLSSQSSGDYNCIAHAALDDTKWWWPHPDAYWPPGVPEELTVVAFVEAFAKLGYYRCSDAGLEPGIAKIAIFTNAGGVPTHAARQLSSGLWTSKLGPWVDIEHELKRIEGAEYGTITLILCRDLSSLNKLIKTVRNFLHRLAKAVTVELNIARRDIRAQRMVYQGLEGDQGDVADFRYGNERAPQVVDHYADTRLLRDHIQGVARFLGVADLLSA